MIDQLKQTVGSDSVFTLETELKKFSIDNSIPAIVIYPTTDEQISIVLKLAQRFEKSLIIFGNNSQSHLGASVKHFDWAISLEKYNKVVAHDVADLTVTVEAGASLAHLQEHVLTANQFLPIDPANAAHRTFGGIVATDRTGSLRFCYGECRDLILGMKIILPDGRIIRAGGKTVKNVAGYDMTRFFINSFGTLGVIAEITFKLAPILPQSQTIWFTFEELNTAASFISTICSSNLVLTRCEYLNTAYVKKVSLEKSDVSGNHHVLINIMGVQEMLTATVEKLNQIAASKKVDETRFFSEKDEIELWTKINNFSQDGNTVQISIPKSYFEKMIDFINNYLNKNKTTVLIQSHAGNGLINITFENILENDFENHINAIRQEILKCDGSLIVLSCPIALKTDKFVWGEKINNFSIMNAIKKYYDTNQRFAAGRFVGGI